MHISSGKCLYEWKHLQLILNTWHTWQCHFDQAVMDLSHLAGYKVKYISYQLNEAGFSPLSLPEIYKWNTERISVTLCHIFSKETYRILAMYLASLLAKQESVGQVDCLWTLRLLSLFQEGFLNIEDDPSPHVIDSDVGWQCCLPLKGQELSDELLCKTGHH